MTLTVSDGVIIKVVLASTWIQNFHISVLTHEYKGDEAVEEHDGVEYWILLKAALGGCLPLYQPQVISKLTYIYDTGNSVVL